MTGLSAGGGDSVAGVISLDEAVALLYGASRRVGPLRGELRIWHRHPDKDDGPSEVRWRVVQDGPRYRWELISHDPGTRRRTSVPHDLLVGDGVQAWTRRGDRIVVTPYLGCLVADQMLDPSWLLSRYQLGVTGNADREGRPVFTVSGSRRAVRRGSEDFPEGVEAVADTERGFLHQLTSLKDGEGFEVIELRLVHLDDQLDDFAFTAPVDGAPTEDRALRERRLGRRRRRHQAEHRREASPT